MCIPIPPRTFLEETATPIKVRMKVEKGNEKRLFLSTSRAFTLVELLCVLAIIGILVGLFQHVPGVGFRRGVWNAGMVVDDLVQAGAQRLELPLIEYVLEDDKAVLLGEHLRIIRATIPLHARLWEEGIIEAETAQQAQAEVLDAHTIRHGRAHRGLELQGVEGLLATQALSISYIVQHELVS